MGRMMSKRQGQKPNKTLGCRRTSYLIRWAFQYQSTNHQNDHKSGEAHVSQQKETMQLQKVRKRERLQLQFEGRTEEIEAPLAIELVEETGAKMDDNTKIMFYQPEQEHSEQEMEGIMLLGWKGQEHNEGLPEGYHYTNEL